MEKEAQNGVLDVIYIRVLFNEAAGTVQKTL
jgi:hypothetical protein